MRLNGESPSRMSYNSSCKGKRRGLKNWKTLFGAYDDDVFDCYFNCKVVCTMYCDIDKESNYIPAEEQITSASAITAANSAVCIYFFFFFNSG
jgi:hypothetical protein